MGASDIGGPHRSHWFSLGGATEEQLVMGGFRHRQLAPGTRPFSTFKLLVRRSAL